jgi:hypothetical protein
MLTGFKWFRIETSGKTRLSEDFNRLLGSITCVWFLGLRCVEWLEETLLRFANEVHRNLYFANRFVLIHLFVRNLTLSQRYYWRFKPHPRRLSSSSIPLWGPQISQRTSLQGSCSTKSPSMWYYSKRHRVKKHRTRNTFVYDCVLTLSVAQTIRRRVVGWPLNNESERKAVLTQMWTRQIPRNMSVRIADLWAKRPTWASRITKQCYPRHGFLSLG